jgi:hypothetical protein
MGEGGWGLPLTVEHGAIRIIVEEERGKKVLDLWYTGSVTCCRGINFVSH